MNLISNKSLLEKKRELYWDMAKAVAIFCVIWGHLVCNMSTSLPCEWLEDPLNNFVTTFHVPLFMFISGYFALSSLNRDFWTVVKQKALQLVVPSITWFLVVSILAIVLNRNFSLQRINDISGTLPISLWFLKSLFLCYFIVLLGTAIYRWRKVAFLFYVAMIVIFAQSLNYVHTISMLPFFLSGLVIRKWWPKVLSNSKFVFSGCLIIYLIIISNWLVTDYCVYLNPFRFSVGGGKSFILRTISGLSANILLLIFFRWISGKFQSSYILNFVGKVGTQTLGIYCMQVVLAEGIYRKSAMFTQGVNLTVYFFVLTPIASLSVIL